MSVVEAYLIVCNECGRRLAYDARYFAPQDAMAHAILRGQWSVYRETTHCDLCPPLCPSCGQDDRPESCEWCGNDGPR